MGRRGAPSCQRGRGAQPDTSPPCSHPYTSRSLRPRRTPASANARCCCRGAAGYEGRLRRAGLEGTGRRGQLAAGPLEAGHQTRDLRLDCCTGRECPHRSRGRCRQACAESARRNSQLDQQTAQSGSQRSCMMSASTGRGAKLRELHFSLQPHHPGLLDLRIARMRLLTTQSSMSPNCAKCVLNSSSSRSPCRAQRSALKRKLTLRAARLAHVELKHVGTAGSVVVQLMPLPVQAAGDIRRRRTVPPTNILRVRPLAPPLLLGTAALASTRLPSMSCSRFCGVTHRPSLASRHTSRDSSHQIGPHWNS